MAWLYRQPQETVEGGWVWPGRTVGAMDGAIEPPWMGLRRVLPGHTYPTSPQQPSAALDVDIASAGAGRSPADPHSPNISGRGRMIRPPCPVTLSCLRCCCCPACGPGWPPHAPSTAACRATP
ncbi:hypothetical protein D7Y44_20845 [Stenotrophomonas maltophilia]|nr:hypothetical protein [Stenotrophomonas maltophilia]MBA0347077.1 hypothetical protein [Stenotrophomonas maltophilia]MBA0359871.1 hypothetical protein [Stenotrophomonas maltophilia]MBA0521838.1 hypothetical protein [Stenotrophomonas maltophilia]